MPADTSFADTATADLDPGPAAGVPDTGPPESGAPLGDLIEQADEAEREAAELGLDGYEEPGP